VSVSSAPRAEVRFFDEGWHFLQIRDWLIDLINDRYRECAMPEAATSLQTGEQLIDTERVLMASESSRSTFGHQCLLKRF
jgi:hypothetical protein